MDVDMDLDQDLMQKFSCMGTTDKDVLISEFQRLLGFQLNPAGCAFFLDMTNWNLQAAIGAYYDFESPNINAPSMSFVEDVTIGEGESVPPDTQFTKTWRIQNTGTEQWPPGVSLKYVGGDQFGHVNMVMVRSLEPQEVTDVSVQMRSPTTPAMYQGQWRMCTATGLYFGDVIWVILSVEIGGLLGVTQQLSSFETEFSSQPCRKIEGNFNPFASPQKNRQSEDNNVKDPGGQSTNPISKNSWGPTEDQNEQDQNGLSQNSVNISPNSHSSNLSVVTYSQMLGEAQMTEVVQEWNISAKFEADLEFRWMCSEVQRDSEACPLLLDCAEIIQPNHRIGIEAGSCGFCKFSLLGKL
ncbi:protein ILRUN isoform X2 [Chiloscyllium plagiosum]|uniref:protein ILRUN isoform X2 n=2 Tax=Hemiscylliidae TaxID=40580 RepID=UPI001CB8138E|nr:protein ILRUN isoform X2 [Chiloscyllium plagiosum]